LKLRNRINLHKPEINEETSPKEFCSWEEVEILVKKLVVKIQSSQKKYQVILGITNGGIIPARLLARELGTDHIQFIPVRNKEIQSNEMPLLHKANKYLVIDEIYDTGNIFSKVYDSLKAFECDFAFLMSRYRNDHLDFVAKVLNHARWVVFPWEMKRY
jgi:hypoxanthine phosphoribosyltransferase